MNTDPARILVHGVTGRMGQVLLRMLPDFPGLQLVAVVSRQAQADSQLGVPWLSAERLADAPAFDVAIDFSLPPAVPGIIAACVACGAALVSGTTGLDDEERAQLQAAATRVPVLWAANFSLGVAVLSDLVARAAEMLSDWDCNIIESHHTHKRDAPSGTARMLADAIQGKGMRVAVHAIRAGDIVGEHSVRFAGLGETLALTHRATAREVFARGALTCALRIVGRGPGRYSILDMLRMT